MGNEQCILTVKLHGFHSGLHLPHEEDHGSPASAAAFGPKQHLLLSISVTSTLGPREALVADCVEWIPRLAVLLSLFIWHYF